MVARQRLDDDITQLSNMLDDVVREQAGDALFQIVDDLRQLARQRRAGLPDVERRFAERVQSLSELEAHVAIRALSIFFDLANIAEDCHRIRVLRSRERQAARGERAKAESIRDAVASLKDAGIDAEKMHRVLDRLMIEPVFTAHPTEAKRRATRRLLREIRAGLQALDDTRLLERERTAQWRKLRSLVTILWQGDLMRPQRPDVLSEVERGLFFTQSLWQVVPEVYRRMRDALAEEFPGEPIVPAFLRFGTWIGGDRDGHPFVTTEVTARSLRLLRRSAIERHLEICRSLAGLVIISSRQVPISDALNAALERAMESAPELVERLAPISASEVPRRWLKVIEHRLVRALESEQTSSSEGRVDGGYGRTQELLADLELLVDDVRINRGERIVAEILQGWLDQVRTFGLFTASMDVRQDSRVHVDAVSEVYHQLGLADDFAALPEAERCALLEKPLEAGSLSLEAGWSETVRETLSLFRLLAETVRSFGLESLGGFVISMTHNTSDVLIVLRLWQTAWAATGGSESDLPHLPIVPLFETIDDLQRASEILDSMLSNPMYREYLKRAEKPRQIAMVGYSDSTKDGGYLAAGWSLHRAQEAMAEAAARHAVRLVVFHGRGGALGRGGGPTARAVRSLSPAAVDGAMRMTEQGEVLAERYDDPQIAYRHLEQVTWATLLVSNLDREEVPDAWREAMQQLCDLSLKRYRALVQDPGFLQYLGDATPISEIEQLPIASRPSRRRERTSISNLRAIPWTFAWTQCRHIIPAWFGVGTAVRAAVESHALDWSTLETMYRKWPLFRALVENAELALAKADMGIAHRYAELASDNAAAERVWRMIADEYAASRAVVLLVTGQTELLGGVQWLRQSIQTRNPYVDPLNFIQIELFRRLRALSEDDHASRDRLRALIRLSIQGIASGLRTTG